MQIKVFIKADKKIKCMCLHDNPGCKNPKCETETVQYDEYKDWEKCFKQNRFGK